MWRRVEVEARVGAPIEPVFAHLTDPCSWPAFVPAVVSRRRLDGGPARVGSRWAATDRVGPFAFDFVDELLVLESDRRVVWGSSAPWNSTVEYRLAPVGAATRVHAAYEGDLDGWLRLLGALVPTRVTGRFLARDFVRLERLLTRSTRGPAGEVGER